MSNQGRVFIRLTSLLAERFTFEEIAKVSGIKTDRLCALNVGSGPPVTEAEERALLEVTPHKLALARRRR